MRGTGRRMIQMNNRAELCKHYGQWGCASVYAKRYCFGVDVYRWRVV